MASVKRYWNGNRRIISDLLWTCVITFCLGCLQRFENGKSPFAIMPTEIHSEILASLEGVVDLFFLFFFWSWNHHHIMSRLAKYVVHALFYFLLLSGVRHLWAGVFFHMDWITLSSLLVFHGLIIWKYIWLMGRKKSEKNDIELEGLK